MKSSGSLPHAGLVRGDPLGSPGPWPLTGGVSGRKRAGGCGPERQHLRAGAERPAQTGWPVPPAGRALPGACLCWGWKGTGQSPGKVLCSLESLAHS